MHSMHESFVFFVIIFKPLGRNRLFTGLTTPMRYGAATNDRHSVLHNSEWGREAWALPVLRKIILSLATFQRFTIAALWPLHSFFPKNEPWLLAKKGMEQHKLHQHVEPSGTEQAWTNFISRCSSFQGSLVFKIRGFLPLWFQTIRVSHRLTQSLFRWFLRPWQCLQFQQVPRSNLLFGKGWLWNIKLSFKAFITLTSFTIFFFGQLALSPFAPDLLTCHLKAPEIVFVMDVKATHAVLYSINFWWQYGSIKSLCPQKIVWTRDSKLKEGDKFGDCLESKSTFNITNPSFLRGKTCENFVVLTPLRITQTCLQIGKMLPLLLSCTMKRVALWLLGNSAMGRDFKDLTRLFFGKGRKHGISALDAMCS